MCWQFAILPCRGGKSLYVIVAETSAGNWAQLTDQFGITSERTLIQAGEKHDIETLKLKE
jgi:hypothetical protein